MQLVMLKKCFPALLAALFAAMLVSCSDDDSTVDMNHLLQYKYKHGTAILQEGTTAVIVDSVVYHFVNLDSLVVAHTYYGDRSQMSLPEKDTAYFKPVVNGNNMVFTAFTNFSIQPMDYLTNFEWEVVSVSASGLKLKLHSSSLPTSTATLKCIPF